MSTAIWEIYRNLLILSIAVMIETINEIWVLGDVAATFAVEHLKKLKFSGLTQLIR